MKVSTVSKLFIVLAVPVLYYVFFTGFNVPSTYVKPETKYTTPGSNGKDFRNFLLDVDYGEPYANYWDIDNNHHLDSMKDLNFNAVHFYENMGTQRLGYFNQQTLTNTQKDNVNTLENLIHSSPYSMESAFERIRISQLCYGQRLVYEVTTGNNTTNYGFCYQDCNGYDTDSGRTVVHGCPGNCPNNSFTQAGWLCKNIYENRQHTDLYSFRPQKADTSAWHIRPMMRIPKAVFDDPGSRNLPVVKINVVNFAGDTINTIILRVWNFREGNDNHYNGEYVENYKFEFNADSFTVSGSRAFPNGLNHGREPWNTGDSKVDFQVYWYGQVEVWFDKMTVDDIYANRLFSPVQPNFDAQIAEEVTSFPTHDIFFCDEVSSSNAYCIKYVQDKMHFFNQDSKLYVAYANGLNLVSHKNTNIYAAMILDIAKPDMLCLDASTFVTEVGSTACSIPVDALISSLIDTRVPDSWRQNNPVYNNYLQQLVLGDKNTTVPSVEGGTYLYLINKIREQITQYSPGTRFYIQPQIHSRLTGSASQFNTSEGDYREPLNEELQAQAMIAISRGAEGLSWFFYPSYAGPDNTEDYYRFTNGKPGPGNGSFSYVFGMLNGDNDDSHYRPHTKRTLNCYGQDKWNYVKDMNAKILNWKPTLDNLTWESAYSIHSEGTGSYYITDIQSTYYAGGGESGPVYQDTVKYWEAGYFTSPSDTRYFMMVNRRCVPGTDRRMLGIKFDSTQLTGFRNWRITDVYTGKDTTFDKDNQGAQGYVHLGSTLKWFEPGEGKLFKIEPAIIKGGTLVADENISGETFTCEGNIYNNGHNLTIGSNTHISFTDTSNIVMSGGTFTVGNSNSTGPCSISFGAATGAKWHGLCFNNCQVNVYKATFGKTTNDTISAINLIDCPVVDIRGNTFSTGDNSLQGCINAVYYNYVTTLNQNFYIGGNTFNSNNATVPALSVSDYAGITMPVLIENNTFTSTSSGTTAILLSGITSGAVKSNTITDYSIGLNMLSASADIFNNTISSSVSGSIGIYGTAGSELNMNASGDVMLGGFNNISFTDNSSKDILVENSFFDICYGQNIFNVFDADASLHLAGYFPYSDGSYKPDAEENCFKMNGAVHLPPLHNVLNGFEGQQIDISFDPYLTGCTQQDQQAEYIISLGSGIYDTVGLRGGGNGGGYPVKREEAVIVTPKQMYDSICVQMRKHNYTAAKTKCFSMIDMFTDSLESLGAISKLYLAVIASDTSQSAATNL